MGMEQPPVFDPRDEKYRKVADLPEEEQKNFADVEGGFITQKAKHFEDTVLVEEKLLNPKTLGGKIMDKIKGVRENKGLSTADVIQGRITELPEEYVAQQRLHRRYAEWVAGTEPKNEIVPDKAV
ncbi:MAG: hypothetical protein WC823_05755, partial [Parcubacteria group bacterium]